MFSVVIKSTKGHVDHQHDEVGKLGGRNITHEWYGDVMLSENLGSCPSQ